MRPGDIHTFPGLYVACIYPRHCAHAHGMLMMIHNYPRGFVMLTSLTPTYGSLTPRAILGAPLFFRTTLLRKYCRSCSCRLRRSSGTSYNASTYRRSAQPQPVTSARVPASSACACLRVRACAWTLGLSTLPSSTFHKTVLLQVQ